ncbi:MAG: acetamidase/formamidase family protein [Actinobacteria bacterium]|nr:acetamidase/formamidase family protein [Actinomycetota bacterium]
MRTVIDATRVFYAFDATAAPIAAVASGAPLTIHTRDAYDGKADALDVEGYRRARVPGQMNPCTGPIAVRGARPGDTLAVTIEAIRVAPRGYVAALPGTGLLADEPAPPGIEPFVVAGDAVRFASHVELPLRSMIGTIGVAPAEGSVATLSLGPHGGNLDVNAMRAGTTVYLPVRVPGAGFGVGDVHATMGDAEAHSGVNIAAEIDLTLRVVAGEPLAWPWLETATQVVTLGVAGDLVAALRQAQRAMEALLVARLSVSPTQARMLSGASVDLRLGQAGGYGVPVSAYAVFPRSALALR